MSATQRFHEVANDALVRISDQLWPGAKLCLAVYAEGKPSLDIVLKDNGISLDEVVSTLRRGGLSLDGSNAYKLDLCDSITGAMAFGYQNAFPPPDGHWAKQFWDIGRAEGEAREELTAALIESRGVIATALKAGAPDWFDSEEAVSKHSTVQKIDAAIAKYPPLNPA